MTIIVVDPPFDWTLTYILSVVGVLLLAWAIVALVGCFKGWWGDWVPGTSLFFVAVFGIFGIGGAGVGGAHDAHWSEYQKMKVVALEHVGFERVDLDEDDRFIASKDGEYFEGVLVLVDDGTTDLYQVNEIVAVNG
jgi:hypothetical protein